MRSQSAGRERCILFIPFKTPLHGMVLPTFRVSPHPRVKRLWKCSHRFQIQSHQQRSLTTTTLPHVNLTFEHMAVTHNILPLVPKLSPSSHNTFRPSLIKPTVVPRTNILTVQARTDSYQGTTVARPKHSRDSIRSRSSIANIWGSWRNHHGIMSLGNPALPGLLPTDT